MEVSKDARATPPPQKLPESMGWYRPDPYNKDPMVKERPCCYTEYIGPNLCWQEIGMRIRWTIPEVPGEAVTLDDATSKKSGGDTVIRMHDPVALKLCLECKKPVAMREVEACAWTHLFHADNHEGIFREVKLPYVENSRSWDDNGVTCYEFQAIVHPTHIEEFRLTFNVKFRDYMIWVNKFQVDHILTVHDVRPDSKLIEACQQTQITKNIYIGNNLSFLLADETGYEALLSLDVETNNRMKAANNAKYVKKVISLLNQIAPGGGNEIPENKIVDIVKWLQKQNKSNKKILVSDLCGLGRVGSALTAYIYTNNPNLTYDEAYEYVKRRKPSVFCHKGLRDLVTKLYPRD